MFSPLWPIFKVRLAGAEQLLQVPAGRGCGSPAADHTGPAQPGLARPGPLGQTAQGRFLLRLDFLYAAYHGTDLGFY